MSGGNEPGRTAHCAVAAYTTRLHESISRLHTDFEVLHLILPSGRFGDWTRALAQAGAPGDVLHLQYPSEAWGWSVAPGFVPATRRAGRRLVVTMHEWSMHPLRKLSVVPLVLTADALVFVSPSQAEDFKRSRLGRRARGAVHTIPIGINLRIPELHETRIASARDGLLSGDGTGADMLIGHFGSLYPSKQPLHLLDVISSLHRRGIRARMLFVGDFPPDHRRERRRFLERVRSLGLDDFVVLHGFEPDEERVATLLSACNAAVMLYRDGVSVRRGSFWYLLELGVPLITTAPRSALEFASAPVLERTAESGRVTLVDPSATPDEIAGALEGFRSYRPARPARGSAPSFDDVAARHVALYEAIAASAPPPSRSGSRPRTSLPRRP